MHMDWAPGKTVQRYFHEAPLKFYALTGKRLSCKMYNRKGEEIKLWYVPTEDDAVVLVKVRE